MPDGRVGDPDVATLMARLADGDGTAIVELIAFHGHRIAGVLRRHLGFAGIPHLPRDEMDGLIVDACLELQTVAGSWRPGGALPWWWAERRLAGVVHRWIGMFAEHLEDDVEPLPDPVPAAACAEESVDAVLRRLLATEPALEVLSQAAAAARVDDDALVCILDYAMQQDQGDPSPSATLAPRYGVAPDALRQRVSRTRRRLRAAVDDDPALHPLRDGSVVA